MRTTGDPSHAIFADGVFRHADRGAVRPCSPLDRRRATSWIEIDLGHLASNVTALRRLTGPRVGIAAVIKADAYGLGAAPVGRILEGMGVERLAVYTPAQARELREAGIRANLLILMPARGPEILEMLADAPGGGLNRIAFTVHDEQHAAELESVADRAGRRLPLHLEIDTGMSRGGVSPKRAGEALSRIVLSPRLVLEGVFTHFATADDLVSPFFDDQLEAFLRLLDRVQHLISEDCLIHAANSAAAFRTRRSHFGMIRPGMALMGFTGLESMWPDSKSTYQDGPYELNQPRSDEAASDHGSRDAMAIGGVGVHGPVQLQPVCRWVSRVAHVKWIAPGAPVGYGETWRAPRPTRVGLVPVGFADGYPCGLSNRGVVRLRMRRYAGALSVGVDPGVVATTALPLPEDAVMQSDREDDLCSDEGAASGAHAENDHLEPRRMARTWFDAGREEWLSSRQPDRHETVWVEVPIIGRVSMDQITIDLTDLPQEAGQVGTEVELISDDLDAANRLDRLARLADQPPYALLCGLNARIPRLYRLDPQSPSRRI
ncbi:MAG: alanine racemase [Planctomycetota bacterium]